MEYSKLFYIFALNNKNNNLKNGGAIPSSFWVIFLAQEFMKKICCGILLLGLMACESPNAPKVRMAYEAIHTDQNGYTLYSQEFSYKGHDYIWFHREGGHDGANGFVHNPECPCYKKESKSN